MISLRRSVRIVARTTMRKITLPGVVASTEVPIVARSGGAAVRPTKIHQVASLRLTSQKRKMTRMSRRIDSSSSRHKRSDVSAVRSLDTLKITVLVIQILDLSKTRKKTFCVYRRSKIIANSMPILWSLQRTSSRNAYWCRREPPRSRRKLIKSIHLREAR